MGEESNIMTWVEQKGGNKQIFLRLCSGPGCSRYISVSWLGGPKSHFQVCRWHRTRVSCEWGGCVKRLQGEIDKLSGREHGKYNISRGKLGKYLLCSTKQKIFLNGDRLSKGNWISLYTCH